jgi:hypothetical protein
MLGLFLIYFIGKSFYDLAFEFHKSQWGFAILGVVSYYAGTIVAGVIFGLLVEFDVVPALSNIPELALNVIAMPFGLLACWGLYQLLKSQWANEPEKQNTEVLDTDLMK